MTLAIETALGRLERCDATIERALTAVETDGGASRVLRAVVREMDRKSKKALREAEDADLPRVREVVVELEQAADSAKVAAEADLGLTGWTRQAVIDAHDAVCALKSELPRAT